MSQPLLHVLVCDPWWANPGEPGWLTSWPTLIALHITPNKRPLIEEIHKLKTEGAQFEFSKSGVLVACIRAWSSLAEQIREAQS